MSDAPPQSPEAEENILGACLLSPNAIGAASDVLEPTDFYRESHSLIYQACLDLYGKGEPVDAITVVSELEGRGQLGDVGGKVRVYELARLVPATANAKRYAEIVKEKAVLRGLITTGKQIEQLGWDGGTVEEAEALVMGLAPRHTSHETVFTPEDVVSGYREKLERSKVIDTSGVPAPWAFLPRLKGSRLYVLAGYTADGKTAAGLQFFSSACEAQHKAMLVSNEMSEEDLTARLISQAGVPHHECESGKLKPPSIPTVERRLQEIEGWEFKLIDDEAIDLQGIRRHVRLYQPEVLIIDHLHRFKWKERRDLEATVVGITDLAKEYDIPILLLAQLNRSNWQDPFPRPSLVRLRETAILEQEAWVVWFVWRPRDEFHQPGEHGEFITAKNRSGPLGFTNMNFVPEYVRFDEKKDLP